KPEARATTRTILTQHTPSPRCVVRVNGRQDPAFADDVAVVVDLPISGVLLPKAGDPGCVLDLAAAVRQPIIPMIENALGVESASAIAPAHRQVEGLAFGSLDFLADLGLQWAPQDPASQHARARIAVACRAAGLAGPIDTVYPRLDDDDGLRSDAAAARALGF